MKRDAIKILGLATVMVGANTVVVGCGGAPGEQYASSTAAAKSAAAVHPLFDVSSRQTSPFPSNLQTVPDATQNTGLRVNLALPNCAAEPRACQDLRAINELDGFSLQPRISIPFDGDIDASSVNASNVFLVKLDGIESSCLEDDADIEGADLERIPTDQVVWDAGTRTLHVEAGILEQHTRYAVIVTTGVRAANGQPVGQSKEFSKYSQEVPESYNCELNNAKRAAKRAGVHKHDIAVASVFSTQSTTYRMEKIRAQVDAMPPAPVSFNLGPNGERTVFALNEITRIDWRQHTRRNPDAFTTVNTTTETFLLKRIPGAVASIAYGKFRAPNYMVTGDYMPAIGTKTGTPVVQGMADIYVNVIVPSGPRPANGWPVAIFGTGGQGTKDTWLHRVAATMASRGIATVCIPFYGNGTGPKANLTVTTAARGAFTFLSGGRAVDQNNNNTFEPNEGIEAMTVAFAIGLRDSYQQSSVDRMVLARAVGGMDVDGDGAGGDLDASKVFFFGPSTGGQQGFILAAVDPMIKASVFNEGAGPLIVTNWWGPSRNRFGAELQTRGLLNSPGVTAIDGVTIPAPPFFDNVPLRAAGGGYTARLSNGTTTVIASPVVNTRSGAMAAQEVREWKKWCGMAGDPAGYARALRLSPPANTPARPFIYQVAIGDQTITNPTQLTVLRAGDLADSTSVYRHDLEFAAKPTAAKDPHQNLIRVDAPADADTAKALQEQIAEFFTSGQMVNTHRTPSYIEAPIAASTIPMLEKLNYTP